MSIEFVTLEDGSEGLIVCYCSYSDKKYFYKFTDPFLPSDTIDITNIIDNYDKVIITKSNRKFSIVKNKLHITDGFNEDTFQQMLKKTTYHSNIYTLSIFKTIQNTLKDIVDNGVCNVPKDDIKLEDGELFH